MVKNLPEIQETCVQYLGWEDALEKGMTAHASILVLRIPWTEDSPWGPKSWTQLGDFHFLNLCMPSKICHIKKQMCLLSALFNTCWGQRQKH